MMDNAAIVKALVKGLERCDLCGCRSFAIIDEGLHSHHAQGSRLRCVECKEVYDLEERQARIAAALNIDKIAALVEALEPFKVMSGELFARNWNKEDVVVALDNPGDPHRLTFGDFLDLHATLAAFRGTEDGDAP